MDSKGNKLSSWAESIVLLFISFYIFLIPAGILVIDLQDAGLKNNDIPSFTYRWHSRISKDIVAWSAERVDAEMGSNLSINDISGTEWPMFSAVFFLWSTEALQDNWALNPDASQQAPVEYSKDAIEAAAQLIVDPDNASWVKQHWGDNYLHKENAFYRMLLISGLSSYQKLTGDDQYKEILVDQVNSLTNELDHSPFGLLDDYPGECYPVDILPAIAAIKRANELIGVDDSEFVKRSLRAFQGNALDSETNLPAYVANSKTGVGYGPARGVGISYMLIWAPELWPDTASRWYEQYEKYFWKESLLISGFHEFAINSNNMAFSDVDSGPVIGGYGVAASAFGIGAARVNNRIQQSYALSTEALVASWPLPNGTLMIPRLLSNLSDAPYLGETALLFVLTRKALIKSEDSQEVYLPPFVYLFLTFYILSGAAIFRCAISPILKKS
ncbi:hypothetical protein RI845_12100 [Thalassotalea nanhaiensis]|uniref:Linalool dehydratase/isomerase domain-containing protein n=1 Tax=Thalassotalea nanhaiensis TaxID=3065648 RepID=A0ABY9TEN1_9GAMM|nr:hypothetical protein RI845_12100 [Colwelliaceae bacterium SQ345]